jgi:hypothetical protein
MKDHWKAIAKAVLAVLAVLGLVMISKRIVGYLGRASVGRGEKKVWWSPLPGTDKQIAVLTSEGWKTVDLPSGVSAQRVTGAALVQGKVRVEVHNAMLDNV